MKTKTLIPASGAPHALTIILATVIAVVGSISMSSLATGQDLEGERVVNVIDEPRHRPVHVDGDLYLLDVQLNPGDESLPHLHDAAILLTFLSNSEGRLDGRVDSNIDYATEPYTHKISNSGTHQTRIIALVNFGPALPNLTGDRPGGLVATPQLENDWFRSYRLELAPGESTELQTHHNPAAVVQVSDGLTHVTRVDGITEELDSFGDWAWRNSGSPFLIRNIGAQPVTVVVNEGRR